MNWFSVTDSAGIRYELNLDHVVRIVVGNDHSAKVVLSDGVSIHLGPEQATRLTNEIKRARAR